ncbi:MAG: family 10 glycosylhydrolase [Paludibacter sp.]|nr:family 10 glycosylhydrolase [Paludibacter sp.]
MSKSMLLLTFLVTFLFSTAADPQREFRANWVATVSNIDWPKTRITTPGSQMQINAQKAELISILDKMQEANMNAVFLQIRPMADALYQTQITTWSSYLTNTRGLNPGYDPLAFAIEEAHKRGMELHGWMNPYRYTNSSINHASTDYMRVQHPEWLLDFGSSGRILDPGIPAVRTHIAQVTKEVIVNYPDIDGIVWDDYFYISAITTGNQDATTFQNFNPQGLSIGDWRRDNVNKTVKEVYDTIQRVNPGIRFGVSPRGIWSTSTAAANKYGVTLPTGITGADNYNSIYCDGLAWLSQGTIDYISPQLYWATYPTGSSGQDYNVLAPWWQSIANKYGRHFYSSQALYRGWEQVEIGRQLDKNRAVNTSSPGSVFYNTSYFVAENYGPYLKTNFFQTKILPPVISWKTNSVLPVSQVQRNGNTLSWNTSQTDGSFVIFAVPREITPGSITGFDYMLTRHWTTNNSFDLSNYSSLLNSHGFAVAYVNRFETMSTPVYEYDIISADVTTIKSAFHVYVESGKLNLIVYQPENVTIYSAGGLVVYQGMVEDTLIVDLPRGVYLVRVKSEIKKIIL